ncbi:MAG: DUF2793 domain-containing protein [Hyphomicrobium sp.]
MPVEQSPNLLLPYIMAAQAQKHVTHNEAIRALDAIVHIGALDRDLAAPPASPANGDRYIVAASPTGAWIGQAGRLAAYQDGAWMFYAPREGWVAWLADENAAVVYDGAAWIAFGGGGAGLADVVDDTTPQLGGQLDVNGFALGDGVLELVRFSETAAAVNEITIANAATGAGPAISATGDDANIALNLEGKGTGGVRTPFIGVNATADATNRIAVSAPAVLLNHAGNGHQLKLNKAAAADTASVLFQTGFSGRAEFGTTGDDNFHVKTSPNGSTWSESITIDAANVRVGINRTAPTRRLDVGGDFSATTGYFGGSVQNTGATPSFLWHESDASVDARRWDAIVDGAALSFRVLNDAGSSSATWLNVTRSGVTVSAVNFTGTIVSQGIVRPQADNLYALGASAQRWSVVYAATGTINTSDARLKKDAADCPLGLAFVRGLKPKLYRWIDGGGDGAEARRAGRRLHAGLFAQDVKAALDRAGVDCAMWVLDDKDDPESAQSLRYDQFIAPLVAAVQELAARVEVLEGKRA